MKIMFLRNRNVLNTKWLVQFVNLLHTSGDECVIACSTYNKIGDGNTLSDGIRLININSPKQNSLLSKVCCKIKDKLLPQYLAYNQLIKKENPDVIICYFPIDLFNATRFQKHNIPIILMIHNYPPALLKKYQNANGDISFLYKKSFNQVSTFQVLMDSYIGCIKNIFPQKNVVCIPNLVEQVQQNDRADLEIEKKRIIYIARVEKEGKRPHLLVESFAKIAKDFPEWMVEIWGIKKYPTYEKSIIKFAKQHQISEQIFLNGYSDDLPTVYKSADFQGFPSKMEGFGLGLVDGMAFGLPAIGFADAPGVSELIINNQNGFIAENIDDFTDKLKILMSDKALRIKMGDAATESVRKYEPSIIIDKWHNLLKKTVKQTTNN